MEEKAYYIRLISNYDPYDRYGRWLLALMDEYNKPNLMEITLEEAKEFWELLIKKYKPQDWNIFMQLNQMTI